MHLQEITEPVYLIPYEIFQGTRKVKNKPVRESQNMF